MKKILFFFMIISIFAYSNDVAKMNSEFILNRGQENIRLNMMNKEISHKSGSNQYVDYISRGGVLFGTSSNRVDNIKNYGGISLGYFKSNYYGFNYFYGKKFNKNIILGNFGYSKMGSQHYLGGGLEYGRIFKIKKLYIYPFIGIDGKRVKYKNPKYLNISMYISKGITLNYFYDKFIFSANATYNRSTTGQKIYKDEKLLLHYAIYNLTFGYLIDEDFIIKASLYKIIGRHKSTKYYSIGMSYYF